MLIGVDGKRCTGCVITPGYEDVIQGKGGKPVVVDTSGVWSRALTDARGVTSWYKNTIVSSVGGIPGVSGETASPFMPSIGANSGGLIFCWDQIGGAVLPDFVRKLNCERESPPRPQCVMREAGPV